MFDDDKGRDLLVGGVSRTIEDLCFRNITENKNLSKVTLKYTSFCHHLGVTVFNIFCSLHPSLKSVTKNFSVGNISYKNLLASSFENLQLLDNIFKAILDNDDKAFNLICSTAFDIPIHFTRIFNLLKVVFRYYLLVSFQRHHIANPEIKNLALALFKDHKIRKEIIRPIQKMYDRFG